MPGHQTVLQSFDTKIVYELMSNIVVGVLLLALAGNQQRNGTEPG
jgi:hypothetical protein